MVEVDGPGAATKPYDLIKQGILRGDHVPGDVLTEGGLAESFGISRTPIREAFLRLEQDGLLERTSRGMRVPSRTLEEVTNAYEACIILEPETTRLAAHRILPHELLRLRDLLEEGERFVDAGQPPFEVFDRWHAAVWDCSHNDVIITTLVRLSALLSGLPSRSSDPDHWRAAARMHQEITDLLGRHEADAAADMMRTHLVGARDAVIRHLVRTGSGT
ncbi:GntR family transcriptional regulator [Acrocarpospora catenulata]|uniref:GntR family transcriptional regulator n=1 Tax=Acrocarpospora catenulata TaxID=2836182 RepID=UPI001BD943F6|nr:GntR family transcriptional regulator [Acrocarpospora catenulata]